eukprot:1158690-Pelagomonas_calceolata.AAC.7
MESIQGPSPCIRPPHLSTRVPNSTDLVEPNGAGITKTIGRAELAAIAAALTHKYTHITRTASAHFTNSESKTCTHSSTDIIRASAMPSGTCALPQPK